MGSVKVPYSNYQSNPNLINFETDLDLQKWTARRKQMPNVSIDFSSNVSEELVNSSSVVESCTSNNSPEDSHKDCTRHILSISVNDVNFPVLQSNVSIWGYC